MPPSACAGHPRAERYRTWQEAQRYAFWIPLGRGTPLMWDATCVDMVVASQVSSIFRSAAWQQQRQKTASRSGNMHSLVMGSRGALHDSSSSSYPRNQKAGTYLGLEQQVTSVTSLLGVLREKSEIFYVGKSIFFWFILHIFLFYIDLSSSICHSEF